MKLDELSISENDTILDAMRKLDQAAKKVLFLLEDGKLLGTLTDGDIRRWILSKGDLNASVDRAANYNPKFLLENEKRNAKKYMKQWSIEALPIVDMDRRLVSIILWDDREVLKPLDTLNIPVVMMAGGLGTRLYPYTKILPKPLIPIGDIPISEHIINGFYKAGCTEYYLIVNYRKNMIKAYYNELDKPYHIHYIDETTPLGTGGGLSLLKGKINSTFILSNCDTLILEDFSKILRYHRDQKNKVTMVCSLKNYPISYGVVEIGENGQIEGLREKPSLSFFTNTGCYIVEPEIIENLIPDTPVGFPDIVENYRKNGEKVGAYPVNENSWLDMGEMEEMEKMKEHLNIT